MSIDITYYFVGFFFIIIITLIVFCIIYRKKISKLNIEIKQKNNDISILREKNIDKDSEISILEKKILIDILL